MMKVEIGDVFCQYNTTDFRSAKSLYKVTRICAFNYLECTIYMGNYKVGRTLEHKNTLLNMKKLSSLEKELM